MSGELLERWDVVAVSLLGRPGAQVVGRIDRTGPQGLRLEPGWFVEQTHEVTGLSEGLNEVQTPGDAVRGIVFPWTSVLEVAVLNTHLIQDRMAMLKRLE